MPSPSSFSFGNVVLVPFPFTDQSGSKQRPAVMISNSNYNRQRSDLVIMAITSQIRNPLGFASFAVGGWQAAGLLKPSALKPVFATIEQILIARTLGQFTETDRAYLRQCIDACLK